MNWTSQCGKVLALSVLLLSFQTASSQTRHSLPLVMSASNPIQQGFIRIVNHSVWTGAVEILAIDDSGWTFGPISLQLAANRTVHLNSEDLEYGNSSKGLSEGVGDGEGDWRLVLETRLDIEPLAYIRTTDGFVTSMHDLVMEHGSMRYDVPIFNPGGNRAQVSSLRLINTADTDAMVAIDGIDDLGNSASERLEFTLPAGAARTISAQELESGAIGDGAGKWYLSVSADRPLQVVNLLRSPTGHLANLSSTTRTLNPGRVFRDCSECPELVVVPAGTLAVGSLESETGHYEEEGPVHGVRIPKPFAVGVYEVTFEEWNACLREGGCSHIPPDGGWGRGNRPVINVNWEHVQEYVSGLSAKTGKGYRLLSESEWEYVARAGTVTRYWWGNEIGQNQANCMTCGSRWDNTQTAPVGSFSPNAFGLHDVHGNVMEYVQDCWHESYRGAPSDGSAWNGDCDGRVLRGGSSFNSPRNVRSAVRFKNNGYGWNGIGFRVGRTLVVGP